MNFFISCGVIAFCKWWKFDRKKSLISSLSFSSSIFWIDSLKILQSPLEFFKILVHCLDTAWNGKHNVSTRKSSISLLEERLFFQSRLHPRCRRSTTLDTTGNLQHPNPSKNYVHLFPCALFLVASGSHRCGAIEQASYKHKHV